MKDLCVQIWWL